MAPSAPATAAMTATPPISAGDILRPLEGPCTRVMLGSALVLPESASENSFAVAKRSAGNFSSAHRTAASTCGGTERRSVVIGLGSSVMSLAMIACAELPACGGSPASISYVSAPRE